MQRWMKWKQIQRPDHAAQFYCNNEMLRQNDNLRGWDPNLGDDPNRILYFPYGPVNFGAGPNPFAVFNDCMTPAGNTCMSVATEIMWNP
jgi:hypothetical protein